MNHVGERKRIRGRKYSYGAREVTWTKACLAEFREDLNWKTKKDQKKNLKEGRETT